jgi:predicted permease
MSAWREALQTRLESLQLRPEREAEIILELSQHLEDEVRDLVASGMDPPAARRAALEDLDAPGVLAAQLAAIEARRPAPLPPPGAPARGRWLAAPWHDTRQAARAIRRTPGFTATVVVALALAIGPTTAILSIGNWLLWQPAPAVRDPDRVAVIWIGQWRGPRSVSPRSLSYLNLRELQESVQSIGGLAGMQEGTASVAVEGLPPEGANVAWVTANYFDTLEIRVVAGRTFQPEDDQPSSGARVVVIGAGLAGRAFGSPDAAIGRRVMLNGLPMSVVGVVEPGFGGISPFSTVEVWYPGATYTYVNRYPDDRAAEFATRSRGLFYSFIGRLAPGATYDQAQAELDAIVPQLVERHPTDNEGLKSAGARIFPGLGVQPPFGRGGYQTLVNGLLLVGLFLLLIGCANVANLLLVGGMRRQRDRAVRLAIGASRARLLQLQLVESCLLAVAGAGAGVLLAFWLKDILQLLIVPGVQPGVTVPIDGRVLGLTLGCAVACGLAAGIAPAWIGSSPRLVRLLGQGDLRATRRGSRLRTALAATQLALSLMLLTGALLMIETLQQLRRIDLGFDPAGVSAHYLSLGEHGYTRDRAAVYYADLVRRIAAVPGVDHVSLSELVPFGSSNTMMLRLPGGADTEGVRALANGVSDEYFDLLRIPLVRGRRFTADDGRVSGAADGLPVIVGESLARRLFGDQNPLGRRVHESEKIGLVIVGVARDAHWNSLTEAPEPFIYLPFGGRDYRYLGPVLLVKSGRPLHDVTRVVEAAMAELDPAMPPRFSRSLAASVDRDTALASRIVFAWALSLLAALGFALSAFGLAGLLGAIVWERTREFGVRLAIGARRGQLVALVLGQASRIAGAGLVAGLLFSWFGSRLLESQLYGVARFDPALYLAAAAALAAVVVLSSVWPAYVATRVNPVDALRAE